MAETCHFCRGTGEQSREHVFAQWLLELTNHRHVRVTPTHQTFGGDVVNQRSHTFANLVLGGVCRARCNSGWMSTVDNNARLALTALWRGRAIEELCATDRHALAIWAAKTTFTLNLASNYRQIIPDPHLQALCQRPTMLPEGVIVVGESGLPDEGLGWLQGQNWYVHVGDREAAMARAIEANSYKTTLRVGRAALTTCFWPNEDWLIALRRDRHVLLGSERCLVAWDVAAGQASSNYEHVAHALEVQVLSPRIVSARSSDNGWLLGPDGRAEAILQRVEVDLEVAGCR